ncbi:MAG: T9SS type A sorting domain-containing protein [Bacteroidetes bacterium]|nr:T9SS type A sorting domain-containing protein [Bacteroidota bacterium]
MKKLSALTLLFLILVSPLYASHLMGGEITWRCNGNGQFIFQVKLYRDCNGVQGPQSVGLATNAPGGTISCQLISQNDISPMGPGCPTCAIPMGYSNAVEEFIYESDTLYLNGTPPPNGWYFYFNSCCRNAAISNLASLNDFTLRAIMYPFSGQSTNPCLDNSPYFPEPPTLGVCIGDTISYGHVAIDNDLDSLHYSWDQPIENGFPGTYVPFVAGYTYQSPLPGPSQNPLNFASTLDPNHGIITFKSVTSGSFTTVTKVSSYKCGQLVSEIFRELQITLVPDCYITTNPPVFNTAPDLLPNLPVESISIVAGDTLFYSFSVSDFEMLPASAGGGMQVLTINSKGIAFGDGDTSFTSGCLLPPCAVLSHPSPYSSPVMVSENMTWPTVCAQAGFNNGCLQHVRVFPFLFKINDNFCPAQGVVYKSLLVNVTGPLIYITGNSLAVSYPGVSLQWYLNGVAIPNATDTIFTPTQSGIYSVIATTGSGCVMMCNSVNRVLSGVNSIENETPSIQVFPNPSAGNSILNVLVQDAKTGSNIIRVVDITGKMVKQIPIHISTKDEHLLIDLGGLSKGIYTIQMNIGSNEIQSKIVLN